MNQDSVRIKIELLPSDKRMKPITLLSYIPALDDALGSLNAYDLIIVKDGERYHASLIQKKDEVMLATARNFRRYRH